VVLETAEVDGASELGDLALGEGVGRRGGLAAGVLTKATVGRRSSFPAQERVVRPISGQLR